MIDIPEPGSYMLKGSLRESILRFCGMSRLNEADKDRIWTSYTEQDLLSACGDHLMLNAYEFDEIPTQSAEYFSFFMDREEEIRSLFRKLILDVLQSGPPRPPIQDPAPGYLLEAMIRDAKNYEPKK
jgi:hypothetical protein